MVLKLDVLAQHTVAACALEPLSADVWFDIHANWREDNVEGTDRSEGTRLNSSH